MRKAWDNCALAHRSIDVNIDFNIVEHSYDLCGKIEKIEYFHEVTAESSKVTFLDDCSSNLNGKAFNVYTKDNETIYNILYSVACGTTKPANTSSIRYILVDLVACDKSEVISLATQLAIQADTCGAVELSTTYLGKSLTITNVIKGCANDTADIDTGFTFAVLAQGSKVSIDALNYTYDSDGRVDKVTTSSGENILNITGPFKEEVVSIGGNGKIVRVSDAEELAVELAPTHVSLFEDMITEMRIMNVHLQLMTDTNVLKEDLEHEEI